MTCLPLDGKDLPAASLLLAADQLAEATVLVVLVQEGELVLIEALEPLVPADLLQTVLSAVAGVIDAQQTRVIFGLGAFDPGRTSATLLDPRANGRVIRCRLCAPGPVTTC